MRILLKTKSKFALLIIFLIYKASINNLDLKLLNIVPQIPFLILLHLTLLTLMDLHLLHVVHFLDSEWNPYHQYLIELYIIIYGILL